MDDLLKEAIADAKAVRETALENAKMALEEAFTPRLQNMLSQKIQNEIEDEEDEKKDEAMDDDEDMEERDMMDDDEEMEERGMNDDDEDPSDDDSKDEGIIEIDGVKYAPVVAEEEDEEDAEEGMHEEDNLDLEAVIKELESELSEGEDDDDKEDVDETVEEEYEIDEAALTEEEDDDKEEVDEELDKSSDIGKGDNNRGSTDTSSGVGKGSSSTEKVKMESIEAELKEYKEAVSFLKDKLHEVNILNAKLLFTNKLFKEYSLNNNQKLKVVETFDRAQSTREIKLVYSTLAEQFGDNGSINRKSINESASSKAGSTKPSKESKKVISEETQVANRFKKLAGLL